MNRSHLESETRRLLRAEIHRSPAILEEYRRRHRWDWVWRLGVCLGTPAIIFAALFMMPLSFTVPLQLPLVDLFLDLTNSPLNRLTPEIGPLFAGQAMLIAAIASAALMNGWACFCQQKDLMAATYWPVSDEELNRRSHWNWLSGLVYLAYVLAMLAVSIAIAAHLTPWQLAALILSIPLNAWHLMALVILWCSAIRTSRQQNAYWVFAGLFAIPLIWFAGMASIIPWTPLQGMSELMLMVPTGWVNGILCHLFFEPHPLVIGYIAATGATWIYAANWLRKGFRIREILIGADGKVTPVFESGIPTPLEAGCQSPEPIHNVGPVTDATEVASPLALTPESILAKIRCQLWHSWDRCGWMEGLISRWMTKRQRTLVEYVYRGHPRWSFAWLISTGITLAGVAIAWAGFEIAALCGNHPDKPTSVIAIGFMLWLLMILYVDMLVHLRWYQAKQQQPTYIGLHPVYPLGLEELIAMQQKIILGRLPFWLPQLLAIASLDWLFAPNLISCSFLWAVEFAILFGLFADTFGWLLFCTSVPLSLNWRRAAGLVAFTALVILWVSAALLVFVPLSYVVAPAFLILLLCRLGIRRYACWIYREALDFECRETMLIKGR